MWQMNARIRSIGPAALVSAAFIGPGTLTTCTLAGAGFGYALLWALLFSVIATVVLQEMAARLGIITRMGLGEALHARFPGGVGRLISVLLILSAICVGNGGSAWAGSTIREIQVLGPPDRRNGFCIAVPWQL